MPWLLAALTPALAAVVALPWFVTQDGPSHLYNAEILVRSLGAGTPFGASYRVNWEPLPNWAGHLLTAGLGAALPPRWANAAINVLTLVGFSGAILWLRGAVAGPRGQGVAGLLAAMLGLNVAWLLGFTSFMLGASLFPVTLGVWWAGRDRLGPGRLAAVAALLVLGYFAHLVSLGLTVVGLATLAAFSPCAGPSDVPGARRRAWLGRLGRTALSTLPLLPLALVYLNLTRRGGPMRPEWGQLTNPLSPRAWAAQLVWADPISIASKAALPFGIDGAVPRGSAGLLAPALWVLVAIELAIAAGLRKRGSNGGGDGGGGGGEAGRGGVVAAERRAWVVLATLLILGGLASPDTLGASHGHYLPLRIVLLGLVALVPALDLDPRRLMVRGCAAALVVALAVQSAFLWDYGLRSRRVAGTFWRARGDVGRGRRVATLLLDLRDRFRANPMLHADCLLGIGTGNILWSNYETRYYYFPVQFLPGIDRPDSADLELLSIRDDPADADARADEWERLLRRHHASIDVLAVWGSDPRLDAISGRWFRPSARDGPLRILRHR